jgi:phosphate binding protein
MHMSLFKTNLVLLMIVGIEGFMGCTGSQWSDAGRVEWAGEAYLPEGAVLPTPETIESGRYTPLSRPLFLYVRQDSLARPEVAAFVRYCLSEEGQQLVTDAGYIRLNNRQRAESQDILEGAFATDNGSPTRADTLQGEIRIDGSSTVYPIMQAMTEEFSQAHRGVRISVSKSGTGGGFEKFLVDELTDINNASRPIQEAEVTMAREKGIAYLELKIAIDGLTVVVNLQNNWVNGVTIAELRKVWEPGSRVTKWNDIRPEWPDAPIELYGPDSDSGTFDYFTEEVCGETGATRSDYEPNVEDNTLVRGVAGSPRALGYFGYAYYAENQDKLKALAIAPASN